MTVSADSRLCLDGMLEGLYACTGRQEDFTRRCRVSLG
jgi:hypothetical protein